MNLSEINNVSDLVAANAAASHTPESLYELATEELDMQQAHELARMLINQLAVFHQGVKEEMLEDNDQKAVAWQRDESYYHCALMALDQVDNG